MRETTPETEERSLVRENKRTRGIEERRGVVDEEKSQEREDRAVGQTTLLWAGPSLIN